MIRAADPEGLRGRGPPDGRVLYDEVLATLRSRTGERRRRDEDRVRDTVLELESDPVMESGSRVTHR